MSDLRGHRRAVDHALVAVAARGAAHARWRSTRRSRREQLLGVGALGRRRRPSTAGSASCEVELPVVGTRAARCGPRRWRSRPPCKASSPVHRKELEHGLPAHVQRPLGDRASGRRRSRASSGSEVDQVDRRHAARGRTACGRPARCPASRPGTPRSRRRARRPRAGRPTSPRPRTRSRGIARSLSAMKSSSTSSRSLLGVLARVRLRAAQAGAVEVVVVGGLLAVEGDEADRRRVLRALGALQAARELEQRRGAAGAVVGADEARRGPWCRSGRRAGSACPCRGSRRRRCAGRRAASRSARAAAAP